jgi:DNA-binding HxlR family transcriptional regulator
LYIIKLIYYIVDMSVDRTGLCPQVEAAFALLAKKWAGLILFTLCSGERHFSELKAELPSLSARVLALRMRELEDAGIVERKVSRSSPVRVSYLLSEKGKSLAFVVHGIADWANKYQ